MNIPITSTEMNIPTSGTKMNIPITSTEMNIPTTGTKMNISTTSTEMNIPTTGRWPVRMGREDSQVSQGSHGQHKSLNWRLYELKGIYNEGKGE